MEWRQNLTEVAIHDIESAVLVDLSADTVGRVHLREPWELMENLSDGIGQKNLSRLLPVDIVKDGVGEIGNHLEGGSRVNWEVARGGGGQIN